MNNVEVAPFQYQYDAVGNKTQITDKYGVHQAQYDNVYRLLDLTNILAGGGSETFNYDQTGNRTSDQTQSYTSNEANQLISGSNGLALSYDANGNVTTKVQNGVTWTYTWNSENKLIQASSSDGKNVSYQYDALGRRLSKTANGVTTKWVYDGNSILLEYENGALNKHYTPGPRIDEPLVLYSITQNKNYYYHSDSLGSITAITDNAGAIVENYKYTSFGVLTILNVNGEIISGTSIGNPYLFTGREYDFETKLMYYRERYYNSEIGVFLSKDPIASVYQYKNNFYHFFNMLLSEPKIIINVYNYVGDDPLNKNDPFGLAAQTPGCDMVPDFLDTECRLKCCDAHDRCYEEYNCSMYSWISYIDENEDSCPVEGDWSYECKRCNDQVKKCFLKCGFWGKG